jgi:ABC-type phosphate transport system substrate-binding protein
MCKLIVRGLAAALFLSLGGVAMAEDFVLIVNKDNNDPVDAVVAAKIYRGEIKVWPSGGNPITVVLPEENALRVAFDRKVLDKSPSQTKAMWAQLTFSGKLVPPKAAESEADVVKIVAGDAHAIGYVSAAAAGAAVKIIK